MNTDFSMPCPLTKAMNTSRLPFMIPAAIAVIFGGFLLLGPLIQHSNVTEFDKAAFANRTFHVVCFVGVGIIINCIAFKIWNKDSSNLNKIEPEEFQYVVEEDNSESPEI